MAITTLAQAEVRKDGFSLEDKERFYLTFLELKSIPRAVESCGISLSTFYKHLDADEEFAKRVTVCKKHLAWSLVPRQFERALANSTADAIWLQKLLGGPEFNPDRPNVNVAVAGSLHIHFPDGKPPRSATPTPIESNGKASG